ncbi:hypothetical protein GCM10018790_64080 [Kitasatospora xanthocidica]|uniref:hypothetical protein n=1 Tax=Kitasatospora xanthocidica TaxID=83382 RepID=UPI0016753CE7|nr:hypothetical protein [Kitasatospora xanthocidica]GHF77155.1 hypothetical protein GCM10018790_64080 [Kitasatospora xanthocidica]
MRIGITGHRGLTGVVEQQVRQLLAAAARTYDGPDLTVVSMLADGPDSWFAQLVLEQGGSLEVVVPAEEYRDGLPPDHHPLYDRLFDRAAEVHCTGMIASDTAAHMAGSEAVVGLADVVLAVWDGLPARGHGGTADVVSYTRRCGVPVQVLWPEGATR